MAKESVKCLIGPVRFSYANVWKARAIKDGQDPKFSVTLLIPKSDTKLVAEIRKKIEECWELNKAEFKNKKPVNFKEPLRDGDAEKDLDTNPEFAGHYFIGANAPGDKARPGILGPDKKPITVESDFYSGCIGFASVSFFTYDTAGNKGIGAGLNNLLKTKDGEPLAGRASAESDFAAVEVPEVEVTAEDLL